MTPEQAEAFAREWIANWNRGDVEAVLAHFAPNARFISPRALAYTGNATVEGIDALRAYWRGARERVPELRFTLDHALYDPARRELCVVYDATLNGVTTRACELMRFDTNGRQTWGEALYGAPV
jgi:hypothetical protein